MRHDGQADLGEATRGERRQDTDRDILIEGAAVFSGRAGTGAIPLDVLLKGDTIAAVEPPGSLSYLARSVSRIDGRGKTVLPGLIDCHVHLFFDEEPRVLDGCFIEEPAEVAMQRAIGNCGRQLDAGVTTVRDLGAVRGQIFALQEALRLGGLEGPRVLASGETVTAAGVYSSNMDIYIEVDGAQAMAQAARDLAESGVQCIKVLMTGGLHNPARPSERANFSVDEIRACAKVAHAYGLRVATHAHGGDGIRNAVVGEVDEVHHGVYMNEGLARLVLERGCYFVPTVSSGLALLEHLEDAKLPEYTRGRAASVTQMRLSNLARAIDLGVVIAAGTDAGAEWVHHGSLVGELLAYAGLGMSPDQAIAAGTSVAAACLGRADRLGLVERGMTADLLLVEGDPLRDLETLARPWLVIQGGEVKCSSGPPNGVRVS